MAMAPGSVNKTGLREAIAELCTVAADFQQKAANTMHFKSDFVKIGQFAKKLGQLQGDWQDACEGIGADSVEVAAVQALTEAWRSFSAFADECSTTGPIRALFNCLSLPQQLANCSGRLTQGLAAVGTAGLQANPDLQEDLQQLARQLARCCNGCVYSREQHDFVFELHEQAEAVRNGRSDAAILSAIVTDKVLQACTAAQLAHDVIWLQEQLQAEVAVGNQVKASLWQQLLDVCQALLPSDGSSNLIVPSSASRNQQPVKVVTAENLVATLVSSKVASSTADESNADDALQAAVALRHSLGADNNGLHSELTNIAAATLPEVAADAVLQALANPVNSKSCLDVLLMGPADRSVHAGGNTSRSELLQLAVAALLQKAAALDEAVALSLVNTPGGLAAFVRSTSATNTVMKPSIKVAILELMTAMSQCSEVAAQQLVEDHKIVPALVQQLAEVKVVKGKPAATVGEAAAAVSASAAPAAGEGSRSRQATAGTARHNMLQQQQQPGKSAVLSTGSKQPAPAPPASQGDARRAGAACMTAVLQLLQALTDRHWGQLGAAGVMPAVTTLFKTSTDEVIQQEAGQLLVKLLLHGSEVAVQAIKSNMVPALVALYEASRPGTSASGNNGSSSAKLHSTISEALLWLLRPPTAGDTVTTIITPAGTGGTSGSRTAGQATQPPRAVLAAQGAAATITKVNPQETLERPLVQEAQACVGRHCGAPETIAACMQLLTLDDAVLTLPLLQVLCSALSCNHQARSMAYAHTAGMAKAIQLATSKATPLASMAGRDAAAGSTASAALAAAFVVQVAEDKVTKPELAPMLGQVLADGSDDQAQTAAWLVAQIVSPAIVGQEPDRAAVKAGIEFCNALAASEVIGPMLRMLKSPKLEHKTAGASAMHSMATLGGGSVHNSILLAGAVPVLVDIVVRSTPAEDQLARAAVGTLASLAAKAEAPLKPAGPRNANGPAAAVAAAHSAVFDLLVTNLQPSTPAKAANAAAALQEIVGASPDLARHAVVAGALLALVKLLQQPTSSDNLAAMQAASRLMVQLLKLCASGLSSSDTEDAGVQGAVAESNGVSITTTASSKTSKGASSSSGPRRVAGANNTTASAGTGHIMAASHANPETMKTGAAPAPAAAAAAAVTAASDAAVAVLLQHLRQREEGVWLSAAAALGHIIKLSTADAQREQVAAAKVIPDWLDVLRCTDINTDPGCWSDAAAGLASLAALNSAACSDLARALRQLVLRPTPRDAAAAAAVAAKLGASLRGRAALLAEGLLPGLVGIIGSSASSLSTRAAAADAIGAIALPSQVVLGGDETQDASREDKSSLGKKAAKSGLSSVGEAFDSNRSPKSGSSSSSTALVNPKLCVVDPKVEAVRAGSIAALVGLIRGQMGHNPAAPAAKGNNKVVISAAGSSSSNLVDRSAVVRDAAESLYVLMGCQTGRDAAVAAGAVEVLQDVVNAGKRRDLEQKAAVAAQDALMRVL